jgi:hypothetical protein
MAKKDAMAEAYVAPSVALGPVSVDVALLTGLDAESFAQNGVILVNERTKITLKDANGVPVGYTLSLYVQRDPITDDERLKVSETKATRTADKVKRETEQADKLAREKKAAFELGQESTIGALKNIDTLARSVNFLRGSLGSDK